MSYQEPPTWLATTPNPGARGPLLPIPAEKAPRWLVAIVAYCLGIVTVGIFWLLIG